MMMNTWHKLNMLQKYLQTTHWICPNTDLVSESIFLLILQLGTQTFCLSVVVIKHTCRIVIFTWTSVSSIGLRRMTFIWGQRPWWGGGASVRRDFAWISFYQSSFRYNTCLDQSMSVPEQKGALEQGIWTQNYPRWGSPLVHWSVCAYMCVSICYLFCKQTEFLHFFSSLFSSASCYLYAD